MRQDNNLATVYTNEVGGRALWYHTEDIHELQDIKPHPFNHVCRRGVADRDRYVHLKYSNDQKLDQN